MTKLCRNSTCGFQSASMGSAGRGVATSRRSANASGSNGCGGSRARLDGAPRSGWPQSVATASGDGRNAARAAVGDNALDRAHDADITRASAKIAAHRDADVMLAGRLHAQHDVAR